MLPLVCSQEGMSILSFGVGLLFGTGAVWEASLLLDDYAHAFNPRRYGSDKPVPVNRPFSLQVRACGRCITEGGGGTVSAPVMK
jgi:hypothetical protein